MNFNLLPHTSILLTHITPFSIFPYGLPHLGYFYILTTFSESFATFLILFSDLLDEPRPSGTRVVPRCNFPSGIFPHARTGQMA